MYIYSCRGDILIYAGTGTRMAVSTQTWALRSLPLINVTWRMDVLRYSNKICSCNLNFVILHVGTEGVPSLWQD